MSNKNEIEQDEYERIARQYVEHASAIKEIVMPGIERRSIKTARRIALNAIKDETLLYRATSRVYNCDIPDDLCANMCGIETCCKNCEAAMLLRKD